MRTELKATLKQLEKIRDTADLGVKRSLFDDLGAALGVPEEISSEPVRLGSLAAEWLSSAGNGKSVVLHLHGGGFFTGSIRGYRPIAARLAIAAGGAALLPEYRLAPENLFPASLDDAMAAYHYLLEERKIAPSRIAIVGDSAGGTLTMQLLLLAKAEGLPLPSCAVCVSPFVDFHAKGESVVSKAAVDPMISGEGIKGVAGLYFQGYDVDKAPVDILNADLSGLPPLMVIAGSYETLLDDATRLAVRAAHHDVEVRLEVTPKLPHVFPFFCPGLPESQRVFEGIGNFIRGHTGD